MHLKRKSNFSHVPEDKRLRADLSDLFLSNTISASRAGDLFRNAVSSNATGVGDLAASALLVPKHSGGTSAQNPNVASSWNSILQVGAWSLTQCTLGVFPARSYNGEPFSNYVIPREPEIVAKTPHFFLSLL